MAFKDYTYVHQPRGNILSYVGVNYVTLDLLIEKGLSQDFCPLFYVK